MKKNLLFLAILFLPWIAISQNGTIEGHIVDDKSSEKLMYASVTLLHAADSSLIKGVASEEDGHFIIDAIPNGRYLVQIFYTGYDKWISSPILITKEQNTVNLDTVRLTIPANLLNMAEVISTKPLFEMKHGTMTMNVEANPTATGDNVLELLKKMPSVIVDHNDNISIEGKSGVSILIDDKPTYLSGEDLIGLLKSMPSNMIEKIEVMRKPSARYDAQGTAGIINIVTKKEKKMGINGSVYAGLGFSRNFRTNEGFNLTARTGKFVFTTNYSYYGQKSTNGSQVINKHIRGNDTITISNNELDDEKWGYASTWQGHGFSFGTDYFINKKNVISFLYRGNIGASKGSGKSYTRIYLNDAIDSSYQTHSDSRYRGDNHTFNLNYKHSFDSLGKDLYVDFIYSLNQSRSNTISRQRYYTGNFQNEYRNQILESKTDPSKTNVFTLKIDYEHPVNDNIKVEAGIKSSYVNNENFNQNYRNNILVPTLENHFIYQENINAAYVMFSASAKEKLDIQLGLRGEHTYHQGHLLTTGEKNSQNYFNLFPNVSVNYNLTKDHRLGAGYRYSIYRPNYSNLNPFLNVSDPLSWYTGNPQLKPNYTHMISMDYGWKYIINFSLYYNYTLDSYTQMEFTDPETNIRLIRPENIGKSQSLGAGLSARFNATKWWNMYYYLSGDYGQQRFDYRDKTVIKNVYSTWFYFSQTFTFLKNYSFELSGNGYLPSEETFGRTAGKFFLAAGLKGNFFKNKLTVRLIVQDILNNNYWKEHYIYPDGSSTKGDYRWESRSVWLTASYRFGKQDIQSRQRRSDHEELNRIGGGSGGGGKQGN